MQAAAHEEGLRVVLVRSAAAAAVPAAAAAQLPDPAALVDGEVEVHDAVVADLLIGQLRIILVDVRDAEGGRSEVRVVVLALRARLLLFPWESRPQRGIDGERR